MLDVQSYGTGDDVVLLHGSPVPPESVASIRDRLADSFEVHVPHLDGLAEPPEQGRRHLEEALLDHGVDEAAAVGHSLGAYRAFQLATDSAIDIDRIAALGTVVHYPDERLAQYKELADSMEEPSDLAPVATDLWYTDDYVADHPEVRDRVEDWLDDFDADEMEAILLNEFDGPDLRGRLEELDVPVYLRVGALDAATPPDWSREAADLLADAELDVVDDAGHFLHEVDTEATLDAIEAFLAD